jgi:hypothetical protein
MVDAESVTATLWRLDSLSRPGGLNAMPDPIDAWARLAAADPTLPPTAVRVVHALAVRFQAADGGRIRAIEREIVDEASVLDAEPIKMLVRRGWVTKSEGNKKATFYLATVPLAVAHLAPQ